jgi:hypothetical protein
LKKKRGKQKWRKRGNNYEIKNDKWKEKRGKMIEDCEGGKITKKDMKRMKWDFIDWKATIDQLLIYEYGILL